MMVNFSKCARKANKPYSIARLLAPPQPTRWKFAFTTIALSITQLCRNLGVL